MINSLQTGDMAKLYQNYNKDNKVQSSPTSTSESPRSRVEALKEQIASGSYKIDLNALATKMAEDLL